MSPFKKISPSLTTVVLLFSWMVAFRSTHIDKKEISWDVFGYYLPLAATFIYDDPMLNDRAWVEKLNEEKQLSGTVYQISSNDEGKPMYFFLFGMSAFYSVFFFIGHHFAGWLGYAQDGFSQPYQLALVYGCLLYGFIGLLYLRKILQNFFIERIVLMVIILIVLGTNYAHHMTLKNLETVNVLFMLSTILIWNTIQWHKSFKFGNLLFIGLSVTLITLVKPSEILLLSFPMLWSISDRISFREKIEKIKEFKFHFLIVIAICFLIAFPQLYYWKLKSGYWIYDTYKNAGVGLDIFSPHILNSLFSYRKGWLLYTPIMIFALSGFYYFFRENKRVARTVLIPFLISFYIVICWTEWWYGAGFSNRPMITYYTLLSIPFGYFLLQFEKWKVVYKVAFTLVSSFFVFLNQFQWWQLRNYILDPYRTTKDYYWATFLKTSITEEQRQLLLVNRDFSGSDTFRDSLSYREKTVVAEDFKEKKGGALFSPAGEEFALPQRIPYFEITKKDHLWLAISFDYKTDNVGEPILIALCMERKEGAYGYKTFELENDVKELTSKTIYFLTPEIRNNKDIFKMDIWKRSIGNLTIDNFKIRAFERKRN
jgi:hypothetical protein